MWEHCFTNRSIKAKDCPNESLVLFLYPSMPGPALSQCSLNAQALTVDSVPEKRLSTLGICVLFNLSTNLWLLIAMKAMKSSQNISLESLSLVVGHEWLSSQETNCLSSNVRSSRSTLMSDPLNKLFSARRSCPRLIWHSQSVISSHSQAIWLLFVCHDYRTVIGWHRKDSQWTALLR